MCLKEHLQLSNEKAGQFENGRRTQTFLPRETNGPRACGKILNIAHHQGDANQNHSEETPPAHQDGCDQTTENSRRGQGRGETGTHCVAGGWGSRWDGPRKVKYRMTTGPGNSTPRCVSKRMKPGVQTKTRSQTLTASPLTTAERRKQPRGPSAGERPNRTRPLPTMEYYLAIKRNGTQIHTPWMNLQNIMLGERGQTQRATCCRIPLISSVEQRQTRGDGSSWGTGSGESPLHSCGISTWGDGEVTDSTEAVATQHCERTGATELYASTVEVDILG